MVSVWDQLLEGLKGVLIQETFYGEEKGTNIIKMILEQGNFSWLGCNSGTRQPEGEPCREAVCCRGSCERCEMEQRLWLGSHRKTCLEPFSAGLTQGFSTYLFLFASPPHTLWPSGNLAGIGNIMLFILFF